MCIIYDIYMSYHYIYEIVVLEVYNNFDMG